MADLARLAAAFAEADQPFLAYTYYLTHYHLTADSTRRLDSGLAALNGAFFARRYPEAEHVLTLLARDFPALQRTFRYQYAYLLLREGRYDEANLHLSDLGSEPKLGERLPILNAYLHLNRNEPDEALAWLAPIDTDVPFGPQGTPYAVASVRLALQEGAPHGNKSPALALGLSAVVPGLGQLYSGSSYDALQAFTFTGLLGYAAFASWRYELDADRSSRTYILPALATVAFGSFYASNLMGAAGAAKKANLFQEAQFYRRLIESLNVVLTDEGWFLNVRL